MGYFTETMALFEFKGDAEDSYYKRHQYEKMTNDHSSGKVASKLARDSVSNNKHLYTMDDHKGNKDYPTKEKYKWQTDSLKNTTKYLYDDSASDATKKQADRRSRKSCKESFSEAFDAVQL